MKKTGPSTRAVNTPRITILTLIASETLSSIISQSSGFVLEPLIDMPCNIYSLICHVIVLTVDCYVRDSEGLNAVLQARKAVLEVFPSSN